MRVALVTDGLFPHAIGGIQRHSRFLALELARLGVDLTVYHPTPPALFRPEQYPFRSVYVPFPGGWEYLAACWRYSVRVRHRLEARPPDVVYAQGLTLWAGAGRVRVPWLFNPHGLEPWAARGARAAVRAWPFRLVLGSMARQADAVVSLGGRLTEVIRHGMRVPKDRIVVLPNAVDPAYVTGGAAPAPDRWARARLLAVGRLFPNKGFRSLVEAMNRLAGADLDLEIIGQGPEDRALRATCRNPRVRFLGEVADDELLRAYARASGYVLPSLFEGMPTVVLEAMAGGLPVIATDVGAVATMVAPAVGWRVPPGDVEALAGALRAFVDTAPERRRAMGEAARARVRERFTWSQVAGDTLVALERVARGEFRRPPARPGRTLTPCAGGARIPEVVGAPVDNVSGNQSAGPAAAGVAAAPPPSRSGREAPPRVAVVLALPTPYAGPFLGKVARQGRVRLKAFYCAAREAGRDWELPPEDGFEQEILPSLPVLIRSANLTTYHVNPTMIRRLAAWQPDVVSVGGYYLHGMQAAISWCLWRRVPFLLASESHALTPRPAWVRRVKGPLVRFLVRRAAAFQVTGRLARQYLLGYGARPEDVFLFPNTPDVARLVRLRGELLGRRDEIRRELGVGAGPAALFVGRLVAVKGVDVLLQAFADVRERCPDAELLVVGDGPQRGPLEAQARRGGLGHVRFYGHRSPAELPRFYAAADVFVLPSREEPWAVVVNEAMAFGLPVIASDQVGAAYDLVLPQETGFIVPAGETHALGTALVTLLSDSGLRARMSRRGSEVIARWTQEACVPEFVDAILHAMARQPARER